MDQDQGHFVGKQKSGTGITLHKTFLHGSFRVPVMIEPCRIKILKSFCKEKVDHIA